MIDFLTFDGQTIHVGSGAKKFPKYFDIDSMSLLLGKNGSGKTHLLLTLAEILTAGAPAGDQGNWQKTDFFDRLSQRDARNPPEGLGVIYYTPLPYRRAIEPHPHFINASTISGKKLRTGMLEQYTRIAKSLGEKTQLVARLSYRRDLFERVIAPQLLTLPGSLTHSRAEMQRQYLLARQRDEQPNSNTPEMQQFAATVENWFIDILRQKGGSAYVKCVLATLEKMSKSIRHRHLVVLSFLLSNHLFNWDEAPTLPVERKIDGLIVRFTELLSNSHNLLTSHARHSTIDTSIRQGIEFVIDDSQHLLAITNSESAVELSWTNLSSGLMSLMEQFSRIDIALDRLKAKKMQSVLVLIDEGDTYLHMDWQRQFVERLNAFLAEAKNRCQFDCVQVVLATHSPIISGDFPSSMVQRLGDNLSTDIKTFGNSMDALVLEAFDTPSIGSYAALKVQALHKSVMAGNLSQEEKNLIEEIGDAGLRRAVLNNVRAGS
ncbi:AAA ATPase-like protein|uniref:AAA ATPase-like protein n=1 Tax=Brenneria salicis ATCC 15712 = DSM 30166 TaxID=714314 RepID=A0A366I0S9_9GAMM|nr:AAA family ATPase [Brenneria salicis]NMN92900.1 AAA ATPase-like protein [Brenneria salicis ATCC 15712 = DSM 30166]RBP60982.1 AAA ATPase-like protein [Brenneria salicis ATCC 15712 = DSM 30166]RLM29752.1 hypothetical protein BHG07_14440 [Brenneria salicis ATCC 15712 = DSM 30166]